jgi:hypothetical protein
MEPEKILHELTYADGLPREALKAASGQRVEMLPLFVEQIETHLALEPAARAKPTPLFFIFHLLGEWHEKAAYRPLARLLRFPRRDVDAIFGDGITTTSHRVMASVFDGDPEPLYDIILDPNAEQFIRAGMCEPWSLCGENSIGQWQAASSATPLWNYSRNGRITSGSAGRVPLRRLA